MSLLKPKQSDGMLEAKSGTAKTRSLAVSQKGKRKTAAAQSVPNEPKGSNLYKDSKGRMIYYYPLTKQACYIPKFDYRKFNLYQSRYLISVAAFMVLVTILQEWFHTPFWIPLVISGALAVILEIRFQKFLKSMQPVKKFDKEKLTPTVSMTMDSEARTKTLIKIVLLVLLGILIVINAYQSHYSQMLVIFCYLAMAFCLWQALLYVRLLIRSPKQNA